MSEELQDPGACVERLRERVRMLGREIAERTEARKRKQKVTTALGVALSVVLLFSLSAVTSLGRRLDTEAVAQIGRAELENHLPSSRAALEDYLQREAPRLVGQSLRALIDLLPRIRVFLTQGLNAEIDKLNARFESEVVAAMQECVDLAKETIEEKHPESSDREKIERLVSIVAENFNTNMITATQALYPEYHSEMEHIRADLLELRDMPPSRLTDEQRIRKDIIETMLELIAREQRSQKNL